MSIFNLSKLTNVNVQIYVSIAMWITGEMSLINIRSAIQEWQNKLCITFQERQFEEDYIEFTYEGGYV